MFIRIRNGPVGYRVVVRYEEGEGVYMVVFRGKPVGI